MDTPMALVALLALLVLGAIVAMATSRYMQSTPAASQLHHGLAGVALTAAACNCTRDKECSSPDNFYTQTYTSPKGIRFVAHADVERKSLKKSGALLDGILTDALAGAIRSMPDFRVIVMGKSQVTTDLPEYCWLKDICTADGRCYDTTRGIGAMSLDAPGVVAEENVLCLPDDPYRKESITVHEFAHTLMDVVLKPHFPQLHAQIGEAWANQQAQSIYPTSSYIGFNVQEYWAESVQAWFGATLRTDYATDGVRTREDVQRRDPTMAAVLEQVFAGLPPLQCKVKSGGQLCCGT